MHCCVTDHPNLNGMQSYIYPAGQHCVCGPRSFKSILSIHPLGDTTSFLHDVLVRVKLLKHNEHHTMKSTHKCKILFATSRLMCPDHNQFYFNPPPPICMSVLFSDFTLAKQGPLVSVNYFRVALKKRDEWKNHARPKPRMIHLRVMARMQGYDLKRNKGLSYFFFLRTLK